MHQLFIVTSLHLLLPVIQTNFFLVQRFTNRRKKNPQKLNVFFLDQNCRNFTPQKLPVIRYSLYNMFFKPNFLIQCHLWKKIGTWWSDMVRYERFMIWEKVFDWSSPFDTNNDRFLKILLLRFYPGATPGKKGNKLKMTMRNRSMKKIVITEIFPQNDKKSDLG